MNRIYSVILLVNLFSCSSQNDADKIAEKFIVNKEEIENSMPENVKLLIEAYPDLVVGFKDNMVFFHDSASLIYNDSIEKSESTLLGNADIEDMFVYKYTPGGRYNKENPPTEDPGRVRCHAFFDKIYGSSKAEVAANLVEIIWCPNMVNKKIRVNSRNGVSEAFINLSNELDKHPEFKEFISEIGGTFNYRNISGTNRLSMHSYGVTIDINVSKSNYWQWDAKSKDEMLVGAYRNRIPMKLVEIFESHGFIWGGSWKHYDTMHFEYRPELIGN